MGRERTLEKETKDLDDIDNMLKRLSQDVIDEIKKNGLWFKGVLVKASIFRLH